MTEWASRLDIGDPVTLGDIKAVVSGIWFDDKIASPNVELKWISAGDVKTVWIREAHIRAILGGSFY